MSWSDQKDLSVAERIARMYLDIGVVKLNVEQPYTWSSGWKSPIYCDGRIALSYPNVRTYIKHELVEAVRKRFADVEAIAGVATAGIPQGALVADMLDIPFVYVRPKPKTHGMTNLIEGEAIDGQKVVLIEDLVSTGGSSAKAAAALDLSGLNVLGLVSIFTYGFDQARELFANAGIPFISLCNYDVLIKEAVEQNLISTSNLSSLQSWRKSPETWKQ
uniref:Orotate phosphoribosyltransferase n=1 Tax=Roseihalotalea indica TaxID=2867963 RepID=A0AA49GPW0_9BACT|nr:orotate phosphoribosyltransferase [Tunicatimonas sp. TK19036]